MANINNVISLGIGAPAGVPEFLTLGLSDGTPKARIDYHVAIDPDTSEFSFEIVATSLTIGTGQSVLITNRTSGSPADFSFEVIRDGATLELYLSSDGATWDIANGVEIGTITTSKFKSTAERIGNEIVTWLDGEETSRTYTTAAIYDPENDFYIGAYDDDTDPWPGSVQACRLRIGGYRYGGDHDATASPFADSDSYGTQTVYSENRALWLADFLASALYGPGATLDGLAAAALFCETNLTVTPAVARGVGGGIILNVARRVEATADQLADLAGCLWFPEGSSLRIQPDYKSGADNPSGRDIVSNGDFDSATNWTEGAGWSIGSGVATATAGSASSLTQTLTTEDAVQYAISVTADSVSAGSFTVEFAGTEVIASQTAAGTYTALVTASGTSNDIEVVKDATFAGVIDDLTVKRSYFLETKWLRDSLSVTGPSERGAPTSIKVPWTQPDDDSPNWQNPIAIRTLPQASSGEIPFIETTMNLPALQDENQALNRGAARLQRNYKKVEKSHTTTDHGFIHRIGDVVQLLSTARGVSLPAWVESVDMVDYGRYRVNTLLYSDLHFPDGVTVQAYSCSAMVDWLLALEDPRSVVAYNADSETATYGIDQTGNGFHTGLTNEMSWSDIPDGAPDICGGRVAVALENSNGYVDLTDNVADPESEEITMIGVMKHDPLKKSDTIVMVARDQSSRSPSFAIYLRGGPGTPNEIRIDTESATVDVSVGDINLDVAHVYIVRYSKSSCKLYMDGSYIGENTTISGTWSGDQDYTWMNLDSDTDTQSFLSLSAIVVTNDDPLEFAQAFQEVFDQNYSTFG